MMFIVILIVAAAAAADYGIWCRWQARRGFTERVARIVLAAFWAVDAVPLLMNLVGHIIPDNPPAYCKTGMWIMFAWMAVIIPKTVVFVSLLANRRPVVRIAGAAAASIAVYGLLYGVICGRTDMIVSRTDIYSPRLPASFDGFRIALFSDLHIGTMIDAVTEIGRVVDTVNSLDADIVFFCGDMVNIRHAELDGTIMNILSRICSVHGTYCVTGNHDTGFYVIDTLALSCAESRRMILDKERMMGWHPVDGRSVNIRRGNDSISVTGIPFDERLGEVRHSRNIPKIDISEAYEGVDSSQYNITLVHMPQMWPQVQMLGRGDLTLSGHVHAMQIKFDIFGCPISPACLKYRLWSGLYGDAENGYLYINDGIGCVGIPARIGARPEITLITLRR